MKWEQYSSKEDSMKQIIQNDQQLYKQLCSVGSNFDISKQVKRKDLQKQEFREAPKGKLGLMVLNAKAPLKDILTNSFNKFLLNKQELQYLCDFMFLHEGKKYVCYADALAIQTFQYLLFNRQKITTSALEAISAMVDIKNMIAEELPSKYLGDNKKAIAVINNPNRKKMFIPPFGLYLDLVRENQILIEKEDLLLNLICISQENIDISKVKFYDRINKVFLLYCQIPEMGQMFTLIRQLSGDMGSNQMMRYLEVTKMYFQTDQTNHILSRFPPEVKLGYLSEVASFNDEIIKYLFVLLKDVKEMSTDDLNILLGNTPNVQINNATSKRFSFLNSHFDSVEKLFESVFRESRQLLTKAELEYLVDRILLKQCEIEDVISTHYIFALLTELSYRGQLFPKSLIDKLNMLLTTGCGVPCLRIQKKISLILLYQYRHIKERNLQTQYDISTLNLSEMSSLLISARLMAVNLLFRLKNNQLLNQQLLFQIFQHISKSQQDHLSSRLAQLYLHFAKIILGNTISQSQILNQITDFGSNDTFLLIARSISLRSEIPPSVILSINKIIKNEESDKLRMVGFEVLSNCVSHQKQIITSQVFVEVIKMMKIQKGNENSIIFRFLALSTQKKQVYENTGKLFKQVCIAIKDFLNKTQEQIRVLIQQNGMKKKLKQEAAKLIQMFSFLVFKLCKNLTFAPNDSLKAVSQSLEDIYEEIISIKSFQCSQKSMNNLINSFCYAIKAHAILSSNIVTNAFSTMESVDEYKYFRRHTPLYRQHYKNLRAQQSIRMKKQESNKRTKTRNREIKVE